MKMMSKPQTPKRKVNYREFNSFWDFGNVQEVLDWAKDSGITDPSLIQFDDDSNSYDKDDDGFFIIVTETSEQWVARWNAFEERIAEYDKWMDDNAEAIAEHYKTEKEQVHGMRLARLAREEEKIKVRLAEIAEEKVFKE